MCHFVFETDKCPKCSIILDRGPRVEYCQMDNAHAVCPAPPLERPDKLKRSVRFVTCDNCKDEKGENSSNDKAHPRN